MATLESIEAQLKSYRFSIVDAFTDTDETPLASHTPDIVFSGSNWLKQSGQNMIINDEGGSVFVAKPVADDFTAAKTLYTLDAGSENFIIRARIAATRLQPGTLMFRVASDDTYYGILINHDGASSYLRIVEFNGVTTTTLVEVNPGSLTSTSYYWYQIHVAGSRVRAFVEGSNTQAVATMTINLSETRVGIGGQRASTKFRDLEVIPLQPGAAGEAFSTKLDVLTTSTELLATSVPSAIASLKGEIGVAASDAVNSDPPTVDITPESVDAIRTSFTSYEFAGLQPVLNSQFKNPVMRYEADELPINFSWAEATAAWTGSEFTITKMINGAAAQSVVGAVTAVGAGANGRRRFSIAYNAADYPATTGVVDFIITADGVTKTLRVIVEPDIANRALQADPGSFPNNSVGNVVGKSMQAGKTYRHRQIARSELNKSSDVEITELS